MPWSQKPPSCHHHLQAIQSRHRCLVPLKILTPEPLSQAKDQQQRSGLQLSLPWISQKQLRICHRVPTMKISLLSIHPTILRRRIHRLRAQKLVQNTPTRGATQNRVAIPPRAMTSNTTVIPIKRATLTKAATLMAIRKKVQAQVSLLCRYKHFVVYDEKLM